PRRISPLIRTFLSAHKSNIYSKLGVQSIVELIDYAKAHELL
ncbi:LuxR C-terminal-related transcriptional regulator, partial [Enterobacter asburiae]